MTQENLQSPIQEISKMVNQYAKSNNDRDIVGIEDYLKVFFEVHAVKFWQVDNKKKILKLVGNQENEHVAIESSLTKQAIENKSSLFENHVGSNKYYNYKIDNPLALKIKGLLIFPILKNKDVIAVLKIWRSVSNRRVFGRKDISKLDTLSPLLCKLMEGQRVDKSGVFVNTSIKEIKKPDNNKIELEELKEKLKILSNDNRQYIENEKKHSNDLEKSKILYQELEASSSELYDESKAYKSKIKDLEDMLQALKKDNEYLSSEVKKQKSVKSIKDLKSEKSLLANKNKSDISKNIENILKYAGNNFSNNEYAYMFFELMVYSLNSKQGTVYIEDTLKNTQMLQNIVAGYPYNGNIQVYNEKCYISDFIKHIKNYEKIFFNNSVKMNVLADKEMPVSLIFDIAKMKSIVLHVVRDLYKFSDYNKEIKIFLTYKDKFLSIEIIGSIYEKNSFFENIFNQSTPLVEDNNRLELIFSKKIISKLKGKIDYSYKGKYYKFMLSIPAKRIKI